MIGQAHIKRIREEPQAELAGIIDPSPKAKEQAEALGVPSFADLEEGLRSVKPDGVVIATPNQLHVPNGLTAVEAGVPMLLEKPVSGDVKSALQLVEAAEKAGVAILVGHHRRHSLLIQRAPRSSIRAASASSPPSPGCACFSSRQTTSTAPAPGGASRAAASC